jgi:ankyrin repeat protein
LKNRHKFEEEEVINLRILEFLLHHPKTNINVADNCGQTPLLLAVMSGNINCVALLLNKGTVPNNNKFKKFSFSSYKHTNNFVHLSQIPFLYLQLIF